MNEDNWNIVFTSYYETFAILSVCMDTQKLYKYLYKKLYEFVLLKVVQELNRSLTPLYV